MRKTLTTMLLTLAAVVVASAQVPPGAERAFATYGHSKGCKMVEMHDTSLKGRRVKTYKSLTYSKHGAKIEAMLADDRKQAKKIYEAVEDGVVTSGYYQMEPLPTGFKRYILFSRDKKDGGTLVYIETRQNAENIMSIIKNKKIEQR